VAKYNIELRTEKTVSEAMVVESDDHTALRVEVAQLSGSS